MLASSSSALADPIASEPRDSTTWLASLGLEIYAAIFAKNGFETAFAVGLLDSPDRLVECGIWHDDAVFLFERIGGPRLLMQRWSPFISRVSTDMSVVRFLRCSPVPLLAQHAAALAENGFDCCATLKNIHFEDCRAIPGIPIGHALALHHIALLMNDAGVMARSIAIPLETWLSTLSPPMHHYRELIRLARPQVETVEDLFHMTSDEVMSMLIPLGHRRTLWSYILRARTYWWDSL